MVAVVKRRTPAELLQCFEDRGRPTRRLAGGYIDDLACLGKCIWLCIDCSRKFASARAGYVIDHKLPTVRGNCDGCRAFGLNTMFTHHKHRDGWEGSPNV